jgi:hypothetical protein
MPRRPCEGTQPTSRTTRPGASGTVSSPCPPHRRWWGLTRYSPCAAMARRGETHRVTTDHSLYQDHRGRQIAGGDSSIGHMGGVGQGCRRPADLQAIIDRGRGERPVGSKPASPGPLFRLAPELFEQPMIPALYSVLSVLFIAS